MLPPRLLLPAALILLGGCAGTTQHFVPPAPPADGETVGYVSIAWSPSRFYPFAVQYGLYAGISDRDVLSLSVTNAVILSSVGYTRYWEWEDRWLAGQFYLQNLSWIMQDPSYELALTVSGQSGEMWHSVTAGAGLLAPPLLSFADRRLREGLPPARIVPVFGYRAQHGEFAINTVLYAGLTRYTVRYYRQKYLGSLEELMPAIVLRRDRDLTDFRFVEHNNRQLGFEFDLTDGRRLRIMKRDPYADCLGCAVREARLNAYTASPDHSGYWIYFNRSAAESWMVDQEFGLWYVELDMPAVLDRYEREGVLELSQTVADLERNLERALDRVQLWDDLSLSAGYVWKER